MCGIGGFVGTFAPDVLEGMEQRLAHRGPDGVGIWFDAAAGAGLVHRRLSIIDLTEAAAQPMAAVEGRYTLVFNGEIYNYKALSDELKALGYKFNEQSDSAVLAPLYDRHGPAMLEKLQGIFAFALWDGARGELFMARDHAGIKPLYYAEAPEGFAFASELKALLAVPGVKQSVDAAALADYLTFLWTPSARTMLNGVKKLRPGHWMKVAKGRAPEIARWYWPPQAPLVDGAPVYDRGKTPEQLLALLDEVVAGQCVSDVPVGAFLSGGMDSSAVVASMCATGNMPRKAYCISFGGKPGMAGEGFEEDIGYARKAAERLGVELDEVEVDAAGILARLPKLAAMLDEPQADPAPLFVQDIAARARHDGIKVLMSGTGGDDVFTGYRRHAVARMRERLDFRFPISDVRLPVREMAAGAVGLASLGMGGANKRRARRLAGLLRGGDDAFLKLAFMTNSMPGAYTLLRREWREHLAQGWETDLDMAAKESEGQDLVNRVLHAELFGFLPDHNLNYTDKASMAEGVEVRVPLTDARLLAWMADVDPRVKMDGRRLKAMLKDSQRGRLPDEIMTRGKTGFGAPVRGWLTGQGKELVEATLFSGDGMAGLWFDMARVQRLWDATRKGKVDGAYTILAMCMACWWAEQ